MKQYFINTVTSELREIDTDTKDFHQFIWTHEYAVQRIPRAQWRQLKREQKAKAKQLSHDLMFEQVKRLMG